MLLIFGGSMGALPLNRILLQKLARPGVIDQRCRVLHITGQKMATEAQQAWQAAGVECKVIPFLAQMELALAAADLVICRGGAMTMAEVGALARPALVVPYPWHRDRHQEKNAESLVSRGLAQLIQQDKVADGIVDLVCELFDHPEKLHSMAAGIRPARAHSPEKMILDEILGASGNLHMRIGE